MVKIRKSKNRGHAHYGWLDAHHTFSFSHYHDPEYEGFRVLRVMNEDRISGGAGFAPHGHRDMEIITYVIEGALEHKDSMGNSAVIRPGEVQYMSAGTGVTHSEFNPNADQMTHLYQIWILPNQTGHQPRYDQKSFVPSFESGGLTLVASPDGRDGSIEIHQDVLMSVGHFRSKAELTLKVAPGRHLWIQLVKGMLNIKSGGEAFSLETSDGAAVSDLTLINLTWPSACEFLVFDLP